MLLHLRLNSGRWAVPVSAQFVRLLIPGLLVLVAALCPTQAGASDPLTKSVRFSVSSNNEVVRLRTKFRVPAKPPASGTLFIWPGLQPHGRSFLPIDNGVLQSVLTWGPSCAPGNKPADYSDWWISAQYVNCFGHYKGYTDCHGGPVIKVEPGQLLDMDFWLEGSVWKQTVLNESTGEIVGFSIDMLGQAQNEIIFELESWNAPSIKGVEFLDTEFNLRSPEKAACNSSNLQDADFASKPQSNDQGTACKIEKIVLSLQAPPPLKISDLGCGTHPELRSGASTTPTNVTFINNHGSLVQIYWIDFDGNPQLYKELADKLPFSTPTYSTHPWIASTSDHQCLGIFLPSEPDNKFVLK